MAQDFKAIEGIWRDNRRNAHMWFQTGIGLWHPFALSIRTSHQNTPRLVVQDYAPPCLQMERQPGW